MTTKPDKTLDGGREVKTLRSASLSGEGIPGRVLLAPWGQVESSNGSFVVDDESARLVVEAFETHATDLPIDYEHQTLGGTYASPSGQAPAAGWIKRLLPEPGVGLLAEIEWTEQAREVLAAKEYRYLSPVAIIRKTDRKLVALHSAALTNKPAIIGMQPIVNRVVLAFNDESVEPMALLRRELKLADEASPHDVLFAASRRLADLTRESGERRVEQRILEAIRTGKLVEAQRGWAEALVAREEDLFDEWLRTAPVVVTPGVTARPDGDACSSRRRAAASRARVEFRSSPLLARLTTEEAFVARAVSDREVPNDRH